MMAMASCGPYVDAHGRAVGADAFFERVFGLIVVKLGRGRGATSFGPIVRFVILA